MHFKKISFLSEKNGRINLFFLSAFILTGFFIFRAAYAEGIWEYAGADIHDINTDVIAPHPHNTDVLYAASGGLLYETKDTGERWNIIFEVPGAGKRINHILADNAYLFAATSDGLYASADRGKNWRRSFRGSDEDENNITCAAKGPDGLFIGTSRGVFLQKENTSGWLKVTQGTSIRRAVSVLIKGEDVYVATESGIYRSGGDFNGWIRLYSFTAQQPDSDDEKTEGDFLKINSLAPGLGSMYAATDRGVLASQDAGKNWNYMTTAGLSPVEVKHLAVSRSGRVFAATFNGVFEYIQDKDIWQELYRGNSFRDAKFLALNNSQDVLWAATGAGLFKMELNRAYAEENKESQFTSNFKNEPTIQQLQKVAIRYAEVNPDKIKNWRKQARIKAILPEFSFDYDKSLTYDSGSDTYRVGPRDWGVTLSWDIGDFVYSDDQTSIDVRSRLTTQLRDDVLDDLNRLYFERRRLQIEMAANPPEEEKDRVEKRLRIEELTAGLDALTGAWFSRQLDKNRR